MGLTGCTPAKKPIENTPIDCISGTCPKERNFVITYGDPGTTHNQGKNFQLAAETHKREVRANQFPGVPKFIDGTDKMNGSVHTGTTADLIKTLAVGNVVYLAIYCHSYPGGLLLGDRPSPDALSEDATLIADYGYTITPPKYIPAKYFRSDAQIRIFGCQSGLGSNPIAQQIASGVHVTTYGYNNRGGAIFTPDKTLGHGGRSVVAADYAESAKAKLTKATDVWLVPIRDTTKHTQFNP